MRRAIGPADVERGASVERAMALAAAMPTWDRTDSAKAVFAPNAASVEDRRAWRGGSARAKADA
jgi:hypothetical protein